MGKADAADFEVPGVSMPAPGFAKEAERNVLRGPARAEALFRLPAEAESPGDSNDEDVDHELPELPASALGPSVLWRLFAEGAPAVRVVDDPAVSQLWRDFMPEPLANGVTPHGERLPWAGSLRAMALNHRPAGQISDGLGDLFYAQPSMLTYVARKVMLSPTAEGGVRAEPGAFVQDEGTFRLPPFAVEAAFALGMKLFAALVPPGFRLEKPLVSLERLMYDDSLETLSRRLSLVRDAGGHFSALGHRMDERWVQASGILRRTLFRTAFSAASLLPWVGERLTGLNERLRRRDRRHDLPFGAALVGEAHTDSRLFTCLSSHRTTLRTEYLTDDGWRTLPLTPRSLVIFPGFLAVDTFGLAPTVHRVLHESTDGRAGPNATVVLGLSTRDA